MPTVTAINTTVFKKSFVTTPLSTLYTLTRVVNSLSSIETTYVSNFVNVVESTANVDSKSR